MLVYRSVWTENSLNTNGVLLHETASWLRSRGTKIEPVENQRQTLGTTHLDTWSVTTDMGRLLRIRLTERTLEKHEAWTTTATSLMTPTENILWVDVHAELADVWKREIAAPKLVKNLLLAGGQPQIGSDLMEVRPREIDDAESLLELIDWLESDERSVPVLILGINADQRIGIIQRATRAAETLAGVATVVVITEQLVATYNRLVPEDLCFLPGDAQLLLPGAPFEPENPALSFKVFGDDLGDNQKELGLLVARRIGMTSQWPEVPEAWSTYKELLTPLPDAHGSSLPSEQLHLDDEVKRLNEELKAYQDQLLLSNEMLEDSRQEIKRLESVYMSLALGPPLINVRGRSIASTISLARERLQSVRIAPGAEREIDSLDQHFNSSSWGDELGRAFAAFEQYAVDASNNKTKTDFKTWCARTGAYSEAKIAMHEAETTKRNTELVADRLFPIDILVEPSGQMVMLAHIKIQAKGGGIIPRLYFHDDTKGRTQKIHVGFIGPHNLVKHANWG